MLSHFSNDLNKEVLDLIREEIRSVFQKKMINLLDALLISNEYIWFSTLSIPNPSQQHKQIFYQV